jgi:hypothetical protein
MALVKSSRVRVTINRMNWDTRENYFHDHGCDFFSLILRGGYGEDVRDPADFDIPMIRYRGLLSMHIMRNKRVHRVIGNKPGTLTLFITFNHQGRGPLAYHRDGTTEDFRSLMARLRDAGELKELQ